MIAVVYHCFLLPEASLQIYIYSFRVITLREIYSNTARSLHEYVNSTF